jgi:hypothetical protein
VTHEGAGSAPHRFGWAGLAERAKHHVPQPVDRLDVALGPTGAIGLWRGFAESHWTVIRVGDTGTENPREDYTVQGNVED